jgi:hypothetical protein
MFANEIAKVIDIPPKWIASPSVSMFGCRFITAAGGHPTHFVRSAGETGQSRSGNSEEVAPSGVPFGLSLKIQAPIDCTMITLGVVPLSDASNMMLFTVQSL